MKINLTKLTYVFVIFFICINHIWAQANTPCPNKRLHEVPAIHKCSTLYIGPFCTSPTPTGNICSFPFSAAGMQFTGCRGWEKTNSNEIILTISVKTVECDGGWCPLHLNITWPNESPVYIDIDNSSNDWVGVYYDYRCPLNNFFPDPPTIVYNPSYAECEYGNTWRIRADWEWWTNICNCEIPQENWDCYVICN